MKAIFDQKGQVPIVFLEPETPDEEKFLKWFKGSMFRTGDIHRQPHSLDEHDPGPRFAAWPDKRFQE